MPRPLLVLLLVLPLALEAAPDIESRATDRAHEALAEGDPARAARDLRAALGATSDPVAQARIRCLLGQALLDEGSPAAAEGVLAQVPLDEPCGPRAAFLRAEAYEQLGRIEEAADLTAEVGAARLGDDRDGPTAEALARLARQLLADPEQGRPRAQMILAEALSLRIARDRRASLGRELAGLVVSGDEVPRIAAGAPPACDALIDALQAGATLDDQRLAAQVCDPAAAELLASALAPDDPDRLQVLAGLRAGTPVADALLHRALALRADPEVRRAFALELATRGSLDALPLLEADGSADAARARIDLLTAASRDEEALAAADAWLAAFPTDAARGAVEQRRTELLLALARASAARGDHESALARYDSLLASSGAVDPAGPDAAFEAGLSAHALGRTEQARRYWDEASARWPGSAGSAAAVAALARQIAFDEGDPERAFDRLRRVSADTFGAAEELDRLRSADVWISSPGRAVRDPVVRVGTRNLDEVELRLHTVDLEAYVRAGGGPAGLADLDVEVIAPDRTWTVAVPDPSPYRDHAFDVPVKVPGPGLYAVTVASGEEQARSLVLVSDLSVVARAVADDIAVATFDADGEPVGGSRVVLAADGLLVEGRTDGTGLWTGKLDPRGDTVVLAEKGDSWAVTVIARDPAELSPEALLVTTELDRPLYLPGDTIGLRTVARDGEGQPVVGTWSVWLEGATALVPVEVATDPRGLLQVELEIPPVGEADYAGGLPTLRTWQILGVPPGSATPIQLGTARTGPRDPGGRTLTVELDGDDALGTVRGSAGEPVPGVAVAFVGGRAVTDAAGRVHLAGPAPGVPWNADAWIVGTGVYASARRQLEPAPPIALHLREDRLRPGEDPGLVVEADGAVEVALVRLTDPPEPIEPPRDPWVELPRTGLEGWRSWRGFAPAAPAAVEETVWRGTQTVAGRAPLALGAPLTPGRWVVRVTDQDGDDAWAVASLTVAPEGLRLVGARDAGLGETLALAVEGAPALVTAESDRLLWAAVRVPGKPIDVPIDLRWRGPVAVAATGPDGDVDLREITVDPSLKIELHVEPDGDRLRVRARATDHAGRPVAAQVALTAWDLRLEEVMGVPIALDPETLIPAAVPSGPSGASADDLRDGAEGQPIAPALLAEEERRREKEKALSAGSSGLLSDNALARALMGDVPVYGGIGLGGMGSYATGSGGGGGGYGMGGLGGVGGRSSASGVALPGVRDRALWTVAETDGDGVVLGWIDGPPARWRVRATAVNADGIGAEEALADGTRRPWLVVASPPAGLPGDVAQPLVTAVNGTDRALEAVLEAATAAVPLTLGPGEALTVALGEARPSGPERLPITLRAAGAAVARGDFSFPTIAGPPDPEGPVTTVAVGRAGALPLAEIALRPDPAAATDPTRLAVAGRAAVAALAATEAPLLRRRIRDIRNALRESASYTQAADAAQELLFLAEARASGALPVQASELARIAEFLPDPITRADRLWTALALHRAGLPIDPNLLAILRGEDLEPRERELLARVEGRPAPPGAWLDEGPPPPGDRFLPEWLSALAARSAGGRPITGAVAVRVGEGVAAELDLARGGLVVVPGVATAPAPALVWRSSIPGVGEERATAERRLAAPDGRVMAAADGEQVACDPCRLAVGDALAGLPLRAGDRVSGMATELAPGDRRVLRALVPGRFTVTGLQGRDDLLRPVTVEVTLADPGGPLSPGVAVARAGVQLASGVRPELPPRPESPPLARAVARIAFDAALAFEGDEAIAARFRELASIDRFAELPLADVARAARALRAAGDPAGALRTWRAGLDAAFVSEAAGISRIEAQAGLLVAVQRVREAALRYPRGRQVSDAQYLLPARLVGLAQDGLPAEVEAAGITATDLRLTAAAWDRELLALDPDHERATAAGMRLSRTLLALGAAEPAARWAARVAASHPDDPLLDGLVYLEALARTEARDASGAERLLRRLAERPFPDASGTPAPSVHQQGARLVLARLDEAQGEIARALAAYDALGTPEASRAAAALRVARLDAPQIVRLGPGEAAEIEVTAQGVDEVLARAYRVDLRTLFLRDGGLSAASQVGVAGVSPEWSGARALGAGPFPERRRVDLPLRGEGAWIVQLAAAGAEATVLVVRSELALAATDTGGERRVAVERRGQPAPGVEVRALDGGSVVAATTDVRGVAEVAPGAAILAWDGPSWAFTDPSPAPAGMPQHATEASGLDTLLDELDRRIEYERSADDSAWRERFAAPPREGLSLESL